MKSLGRAFLFLLLAPALMGQEVTATLFTTAPDPEGLTVTVAGRTVGPYRNLEGTPAFSVDGSHSLIAARKTGPGNAYDVVVSGQLAATLTRYNGVMDLSISEDGSLWSLVAGLPTTTRQNSVRFVNGKESPPLGACRT